MGLLNLLSDLRNPTRMWIENPRLPLEFDFSKNELNGIGLGEAIDKLSFLGKAAQWKPSLAYPQKGIAVDYDNDCIEGFLLNFSTDSADGFERFPGQLWFKNREVRLTEVIGEQNVLDVFGQPYWIDRDDVETILFYEFNGIEWQLELSKTGFLQAVIVTASPLLAREDQRKAYGVSKPWPPH